MVFPRFSFLATEKQEKKRNPHIKTDVFLHSSQARTEEDFTSLKWWKRKETGEQEMKIAKQREEKKGKLFPFYFALPFAHNPCNAVHIKDEMCVAGGRKKVKLFLPFFCFIHSFILSFLLRFNAALLVVNTTTNINGPRCPVNESENRWEGEP